MQVGHNEPSQVDQPAISNYLCCSGQAAVLQCGRRRVGRGPGAVFPEAIDCAQGTAAPHRGAWAEPEGWDLLGGKPSAVAWLVLHIWHHMLEAEPVARNRAGRAPLSDPSRFLPQSKPLLFASQAASEAEMARKQAVDAWAQEQAQMRERLCIFRNVWQHGGE
eukprot:CAMPEP_0115765996 /NCGR_PEP_ID=MMETSP0272-20121206/102891_1 /TAXON_ID=71861 /ORGANISM="Scrippsiella trochoidea, Strain CCMP3099" /LENGTH=162 /DNA_ID=CAMNT_0003211887 /DNA_START=73 /DNA_END=562 /DNA_ORIENTATION=+